MNNDLTPDMRIFKYLLPIEYCDFETKIALNLPEKFTICDIAIQKDRARMESLRPLAKQISEKTGQKIKLIRLKNREEIEDIS